MLTFVNKKKNVSIVFEISHHILLLNFSVMTRFLLSLEAISFLIIYSLIVDVNILLG